MSSVWRLRRASGLMLEAYVRRSSWPLDGLRFRQTLRTVEQLPRGARVLDAGCGNGILTGLMAHAHPDWFVVGLDAEEALLANARWWAAYEHLPNATFIPHDLTLPLPETGFDAVLAIQCLTEIEDDDAAIRNLAAALKPGGIFVANVPHVNWKPLLPGAPASWQYEFRHGYSTPELRRKFEAAGLEVHSITSTSRGTVRLAADIRYHAKDCGLRLIAALTPVMQLATRLEDAGFTWGSPRTFHAVAKRRGAEHHGSP